MTDGTPSTSYDLITLEVGQPLNIIASTTRSLRPVASAGYPPSSGRAARPPSGRRRRPFRTEASRHAGRRSGRTSGPPRCRRGGPFGNSRGPTRSRGRPFPSLAAPVRLPGGPKSQSSPSPSSRETTARPGRTGRPAAGRQTPAEPGRGRAPWRDPRIVLRNVVTTKTSGI